MVSPTPEHRVIAKRLIQRNEGVRLKAYRDSKGIYTIGVGHNLEAYPIPGRTIADLVKSGITQQVCDQLLAEDIERAEADARNLCPVFHLLSPLRKAILIDMSFNLGRRRLSGFQNFMRYIVIGAHDDAAFEIVNSQYRRDVKSRAWRNAYMWATNEILP